MEQRILGKSGLKASVIGLGCWQLGGDFGQSGVTHTNEILAEADNQHISFWDTADVYGAGKSEQAIGDWLQRHPKPRVVASKLGRDGALYPDNYSKQAMQKSIESTLERLQISCIDLIQLHCIPPEHMRNEAVWQHLEDFRSQGLIKHYGASVETIEEAKLCLEKPGLTSLQIIFNLFRQDAVQSLLPLAQQADVGVIVRLPLASGLLSGKFSQQTQFEQQDHRNYNRDGEAFNVGETFSGLPYNKGLELMEQLKAIAGDKVPLAQFALRWIIDHPQVTTVIAGASHPKQVQQNAQAAALSPLSADVHKQLKQFYLEQVKPHVRGAI